MQLISFFGMMTVAQQPLICNLFVTSKKNTNVCDIFLDAATKGFDANTRLVHKGLFTNYVDKILAFFFDQLPSCIDIFYGINIDKQWTFLDHLPTSS